MVITAVAGKLETHETGTTTTDDQVDGIVIVAGTETNDEAATVTMLETGIEPITVVGTDSGTSDHWTIASDGDEATVMTWLDGKVETNETGTKTGLDQVDGTVKTPDVTVAGTYGVYKLLLQCKALTGTTMYELGMVTDFGTNDGNVVGTTDQMLCGAAVAGTVIVPHVLITSPEEIT